MSGPEPLVTVIVPVRNEARHVAAALGAVLDGDYPRDRLEVFVVDGRSTDGTRAIAEGVAAADDRVRVIDNPGLSAAAGLNVGLASAHGDIVARMDGHAIPAPDYVRRVVAALERTGAEAVGGPMVGRGESSFGRAVALAQATRLASGGARYRLGGKGPVDTVYLGAWRRQALERIGGFDESLVHNQDAELCIRLREAGGTVWLDPTIRSVTITRSTIGGLATQYFGYGLGRSATLVRHPFALAWRQAVPALFAAGLVVGTLAASVWRPARMAWALSAGAYLALLVAVGLRIAARAGSGLFVPAAVAIATMHLAWGAGFWFGLGREAARRFRGRLEARPRGPEGLRP